MSSNPPAAPNAAPRRGPKQVVRKSKEERDAIERQAEQDRRNRAAASQANEAYAERERLRKYGIHATSTQAKSQEKYHGNPVTYRMGKGGRGGFMGSKQSARPKRDETQPHEALGNSKAKVATRTGNTTVDVLPGPDAEPDASTADEKEVTTPSASRKANNKATTTRKKTIKAEPDGEYKGSSIEKRQATPDHLYISDDSQAQGARDVDHIIEISSDEEDDEGRRRQKLNFAPHRLPRQQHKDREADINDETSSLIAQPGQRRGRDDTSPTDTRRKGKERMTIKPDPEAMEGVEGAAATAEDVPTIGVPDAEAGAQEDRKDVNMTAGDADDEEESKASVAAKIRKRRPPRQPAFSTLEEREEYEREQAALRSIVREFGQVDLAEQSDARGDASGEDRGTAPPAKAGKLDNATYLFQFPPILPDLYQASRNVKPDPDAEDRATGGQINGTMDVDSDAEGHTDKKPVKVEDGDDSGRPKAPTAGNSRKAWLEPGKVGKLRVHASGKMTLDWGGTALAAGAGIDAHFLQTIMMMQLDQDENIHGGQGSGDPESRPRTPSTAPKKKEWNGDATSFGQVRGKILVTPDWQEILG